jgi:hypothetical protein
MKTSWIAALCGISALLPASCRAEQPVARVKARVVDDQGKPVKGAVVGLGTLLGLAGGTGNPGDFPGTRNVRGSTDENGTVVLECASPSGRYGMSVKETTGYYRDQGIDVNFTSARNGRWLPWETERKFTLKRILKPIPMRARTMGDTGRMELPELGKTYGYDLEACDWLPPLGRGKRADLCFELSGTYEDAENCNLHLTITTPGKGNGLVEFLTPKRNAGSRLLSGHKAPEDGYTNRIVRNYRETDGNLEANPYDPARNYYFRVRTKFDEKGEIVSAHYGKIYGDFRWGSARSAPASLHWLANYYNPVPNDRNVEFDPKRNLRTPQRGEIEVQRP